MPAGRPTKYIEEYAPQARKLCELGATDADLARFFEVSTPTIWSWTTKHPEFLSAVKCGKEAADELIVRSLYHRARGYTLEKIKPMVVDKEIVDHEVTEHYPPDVTACIWWLKNRRPQEWRDRHEFTGTIGHEHSGTITHQHQLADPAALAAAPLDEVQREFSEAIALAPGVQLLPPAAPARDGAVSS